MNPRSGLFNLRQGVGGWVGVSCEVAQHVDVGSGRDCTWVCSGWTQKQLSLNLRAKNFYF